jgi:acyl-CoA dehydrogenase
MKFEYPPQVRPWCQRLEDFMDRFVLPSDAAWHQLLANGVFPPPFMADLKALARSNRGVTAACCTLPEQLLAQAHIR